MLRRACLLAALTLLVACPKPAKRREVTGQQPAPPPPPPTELKVPIMSETQKREYDEALIKALAAPPAKTTSVRGPQRTMEVKDWGGKPRYRLTLDLSSQVLGIDIPEDRDYGDREGDVEPQLERSFYHLGQRAAFISAAALAHKAKQFDDGLYAAVERAVQQGTGRFAGKRDLIAGMVGLLGEAAAGPELQAAAVVAAAARLGGLKLSPSDALDRAAEAQRTEFLEDARRSKPIGFYTWSEELVRIFQQDRMLQTELKPDPARALARALAGDAKLRDSYAATLELYARLTNPFAKPDLRELMAEGAQPRHPVYAIVPPSVSHETELVKRLYGNRPIPDGFNLADELIRQLRTGKLSLAPSPRSGWYDHQVYALEPLVLPEKTPEASRLKLSEAYRKELVGLFKALLALTRETHIKQLEVPAAGAGMPELTLRPELTVEPLATYYLRRARSYAFVRQVLERAFGAEALKTMRRLTPAGPTNISLEQELQLVQGLFHGAYLTVCDELGLPPEGDKKLGQPAVDLELFRFWAASMGKDPDMFTDMRVMVPLFYDIQRRKMKVWVVLGVTEKKLRVFFAKRPKVKAVVDAAGKKVKPRIDWDEATPRLTYFVTAEVYVTKLLDREQFRAHCDRHKTTKAILSNLQ
jgi:hypothetical protein